MESFIPLISAIIGSLVALIVVFINQVMEQTRWKENLTRKGEDKYLDKKLEILHETNVEFFINANQALALSKMGLDTIQDEFKGLDNTVRQRIAITSPYLDNSFKERIENLYDILTNIRLMLSGEFDGTDEELITNLLWLNEELWHFRDDLILEMKGFYKTQNKTNWFKWFILVSVIINIFYTVYFLILNYRI